MTCLLVDHFAVPQSLLSSSLLEKVSIKLSWRDTKSSCSVKPQEVLYQVIFSLLLHHLFFVHWPLEVKKRIMAMLVFLLTAAMTWYKDSRPLTSAAGVSILNRGQVLEIDRAQVSDAGLYKCVAVNVAGTAELALSLQVYGE